MNWSFLLRAVAKWRRSQRFCWLMLMASGIYWCFTGQVLLPVLGLALVFYGHTAAKKAQADIELGKSYFLKDIRALSGAVEHQKLSDELRQAFIARLSQYESQFLELKL